jgi:hypothetical protein
VFAAEFIIQIILTMYPKNKENENMFNSHKGSEKEDG